VIHPQSRSLPISRLSVTNPANFLDAVSANSYSLPFAIRTLGNGRLLSTLGCAVMKGKDIGLPHLRTDHCTSADRKAGELARLMDGIRSWLRACRRELLKFFSPIQYNSHLVGRPTLHIGLDKKESLTIRAHVVDSIAQPTH
jgi:hypothetical protein